MSCFYTNANSLIGKMEEFRERVIGYDIIGVTETWGRSDITDAEMTVDGFTMFRVDRKDSRGGGVALYVNSSLPVTMVNNLTDSGFSDSVWCKIQMRDGQLLVGVCYRSPSSSDANNIRLLQLLRAACNDQEVRSGRCHLLIMGDFNYPEIDFAQSTVVGSLDSAPTQFFEEAQDLFLHQHVQKPTRVREGNVPSLLDLIFTDDNNLIDTVDYHSPIGKSDHVCLRWRMAVQKIKSSHKDNRFNFWKGDYRSMNADIGEVDWEALFLGKGVEERWQMLKDFLTVAVEKYVPRRSDQSVKKKQNVIQKETIEMMKLRARMWTQYRALPTHENFHKYKAIRNKVNYMVRADHAVYQKRILQSFKGNPKRFYAHMRKLQTVQDRVTKLTRTDGTETVDDAEAAEVLCGFFKSVFTVEEAFCAEEEDNGRGEQREQLEGQIMFSRDVVLAELLALDSTKSPGPDGLHPHLLKNCADSIAGPLSSIFQQSIDTGEIPEDWRLAEVCPIFKKGRRSDPGNYRPVSLTSVACKVMETIIRKHLLQMVEGDLSDSQHGFRKGRSCLTNLLETFEEWTRALDNGYGLDVVYLDYRKAFDSVPHKRLLSKLKAMGIPAKFLAWIKDFLSHRRMRVRVNGSFSQWENVISGVPQGSILGPLLFLLFVNDLPDSIISSIRMFADDVKLSAAIKTETDGKVLQHDLDSLSNWSEKWLLRFNLDKCKLLHIGHCHNTSYNLRDGTVTKQLVVVEEEKDLGVYTTADLHFSTQCSKAAARASSVLGLIHRNFRRIDVHDFRVLYKMYVRPHLEYCVQAWSPWLIKDMNCLENVQRRATRMVSGLRYKSYSERLRILGLTTLQQRRKRGDLIETYKLLTGKEAIDWRGFFQHAPTAHGLRGHSLKLFVPPCHKAIRKNFFSCRVVEDWNSLPQEIIDSATVDMFKRRLDAYWSHCDDMSN